MGLASYAARPITGSRPMHANIAIARTPRVTVNRPPRTVLGWRHSRSGFERDDLHHEVSWGGIAGHPGVAPTAKTPQESESRGSEAGTRADAFPRPCRDHLNDWRGRGGTVSRVTRDQQ